jgi:hypothetical protein
MRLGLRPRGSIPSPVLATARRYRREAATKLGATCAGDIDILAGDDESRACADRLRAILDRG